MPLFFQEQREDVASSLQLTGTDLHPSRTDLVSVVCLTGLSVAVSGWLMAGEQTEFFWGVVLLQNNNV